MSKYLTSRILTNMNEWWYEWYNTVKHKETHTQEKVSFWLNSSYPTKHLLFFPRKFLLTRYALVTSFLLDKLLLCCIVIHLLNLMFERQSLWDTNCMCSSFKGIVLGFKLHAPKLGQRSKLNHQPWIMYHDVNFGNDICTI